MFFWFSKKPEMIYGEEVDLQLEQKVVPSRFNRFVPSFCYGIYLHNTNTKIGCCDIRLGKNEELYYAGNIGYTIVSEYRGHHYARKATELLFQVALEQHLDQLLITCSPDNDASRKTILELGGVYIETVDVPKRHWLYKRNEKVKEIYMIDLRNRKEK